jgi:general secretion pathway protein J
MTRLSRGFTLIEVLVAIGLLAVGMTLAVAALRGLTQSSAHAEITAQRDERLRAVQALLRNQLSGALPISFGVDPDNGITHELIGSADKLTFVAGMPGYLSRGGAYLQSFSLVAGNGGKQLVYEFQQLGPDGPLPAERAPKVLLDGIAEADFEYRTIDQQFRPGPWLAQWNESGSLPPLLRLRLRFADPRKSWPDLVVAVRLAAASPLASAGTPAPIDQGAAQ